MAIIKYEDSPIQMTAKGIDWKRLFKYLLMYLLISIGLTAIMCFNCLFDIEDGWRSIFYSFLLTIVLWNGNGILSEWLDRKISWVEKPIVRAVVGIIGMVVYSVIALGLVGAFFYLVLFKASVDWFFSKALPELLISGLVITSIISLILYSRAFLQHWRQAELIATRLQKEKYASQYRSLKNQLNPHFLFNSLNTLSALVYKDPDASAKFIKQLSQIYRYVLEYSEKEIVPLSKELEFIEDYLELLSIRFGNNLRYEQSIIPEMDEYIAPLTLQLLVENAIKHNIVSSDQPLLLVVKREDDMIIIQNRFQPKSQVQESTGIGLKNIQLRYEQLSDKAVEVLSNESFFTVKVPVLSVFNPQAA